ncbi:MAG: hypothetical protein GY793_11895 [Proteobacteria bacterium]|nr:hypothetical protein [Pseudomonadota bacterium]
MDKVYYGENVYREQSTARENTHYYDKKNDKTLCGLSTKSYRWRETKRENVTCESCKALKIKRDIILQDQAGREESEQKKSEARKKYKANSESRKYKRMVKKLENDIMLELMED